MKLGGIIMTALGCNVKSCCHNNENCCCLSSIKVDGTAADKCDDTCCGSFFEDKSGVSKNAVKNPQQDLYIQCEATNCIYNEREQCYANHVDISGITASDAGETVCSTFEDR
jgi:hypothetical protein